MNEDKSRIKVQKGQHHTPLLTRMHADPPIFFLVLSFIYVSRYLKILLSKTLIQQFEE